MNETLVRDRFEDILGRIRRPGRLTGGECGAGRGFGNDPDEIRVVLGFPDAYEIGISNQAIQILYALARGFQGVAVERTYLPWVDATSEMRRLGVPLLTLETWSPVASADLLGLTLQHEFNYTNVIEMLDLAGIPLRTVERDEDCPIVIGGGPAAANFFPLLPFLDAVAVGDGEELFLEVLAAVKEGKRNRESRAQTKRRLSQVSGVYVADVSDTVTRRTLPRLEGAFYPSSCLVPLTAGVHDRAWLEVMRGCTRGCRFCQAGAWYRPVRERSPEAVVNMAAAQLAATGHEELALASLSTTDYSYLEELLARVKQEFPEIRVSLPSLRVDSAAVRLAHLLSHTGSSITLAPEAGSQRMRDIINKNVTEDEILGAAEEACRCGYTTLKLYFIIGFPEETDTDAAAIADLCLRIRDVGRTALGTRASRLQLNVSVNNFVPKPFTPFQWAGMADRATLRRRQDMLRVRLRRPGVRLALHDVDKSFLEAALARGGTEMGQVIEAAWGYGARFDSWTEEFRAEAWSRAFEDAGMSAEELATATLDFDDPLPWDLIEGTIRKDFLRSEWERAVLGETTSDCRWNPCSVCGACGEEPGNDLAWPGIRFAGGKNGSPPSPDFRSRLSPSGGTRAPTDGATLALTKRYLVTFSVTGRARFIGHLDRLEVLRRAVRRAGGTLAMSAGMRPKPLLSLALPLGVGIEGKRELCEIELSGEPPQEFTQRLSGTLPEGMGLLSVEQYDARRRVAARVTAVEYELELLADELGDSLDKAVQQFESVPQLVVEERREERTRRVDVKQYVDRVSFEAGRDGLNILRFTVRLTSSGSVRPERIADALGRLAGRELVIARITRTRIDLS